MLKKVKLAANWAILQSKGIVKISNFKQFGDNSIFIDEYDLRKLAKLFGMEVICK